MLDRDSRLSNWRIVIVAALMMAIGGAYPFAASLEKALFPTLAEGETVMRDLVRGPEIVCVVWSRHKLRAAKIENADLNIERRDGYISYGGALTPAPGGIVYLAPHISAPPGPYGHDTVICANMAYSAVAQREAGICPASSPRRNAADPCRLGKLRRRCEPDPHNGPLALPGPSCFNPSCGRRVRHESGAKAARPSNSI